MALHRSSFPVQEERNNAAERCLQRAVGAVLAIVFAVSPLVAQAPPPVPPCDPGDPLGNDAAGYPVRPRGSGAECRAFRAAAETRPDSAAVVLLEMAAAWQRYAADRLDRLATDLPAVMRREIPPFPLAFVDAAYAVEVAARAAWLAVFYLGAAGPCVRPFTQADLLSSAVIGQLEWEYGTYNPDGTARNRALLLRYRTDRLERFARAIRGACRAWNGRTSRSRRAGAHPRC